MDAPKSISRHLCCVLCVLAWGVSAARAETSYPMVMSLHPLAVQVGQTAECEVSARYNLYGAYQVFVAGAGVTGEVVLPPEPQPPPEKKPDMPKLKVRFTAAADAIPGIRSFRLATPQGATTTGNLVVVRDPVVVEGNDNNSPATAQVVTLPAALCGTLEQAEDVDCYKFTVGENASCTFHVYAQRCEDQIHDLQEHVDPIVTVRNATGSVIAMNDNFFHGDPLLHVRFPAPGEYVLEVRDVRYHGNADWRYCVEATTAPFVTSVHPMRVAPGANTPLQLTGFNLPAHAAAALRVPADANEGLQWAALDLAGQPATVPVVVSRLPEMVEADADNDRRESAQPLAVPVGLSGCIGSAGDVDHYVFDARQGDRFTIEIVARRHQSALDPLLRVLDGQGNTLAESDDLSTGRHTFADPLLENWTAPADGRYVLRVSDLHDRGGPEFVYCLQVTRAEPYFTLDLDTDKTLLAPGMTAVIYARVYRKNGFAGEVQLAVEGLPPGVTATCGRILANGNDGVIFLQGAPDAHVAAANVRVTGTGTVAGANGQSTTVTAVASPMQEIYMPGGGRSHYPADMHTVAICDALDIQSVNLSAQEVHLKPGGSQRIDITIQRRPGFTGNVTLDVLYQHLGSIYGNSLPQGVSIDEKDSQTLLSGEQTQGYITLVAAADAPLVDKQLVPIMAHVSINFVMKLSYSAPPLTVTVAAP